LYVQGKHTPEKERKKMEKKKKRKRERERESQKKPKITPKTLNHQIQMAHTKKNKKNTCVSPAATGICPKFGAQKNTTPEGKKQLQFSFQKGSGVGFPKICYQLVVDWERITGFQLIGGMAAEGGNKS
jgi:hypothetical protein